MGARGPAPKPTALRVLQGDKKNRINTNEPPVRDEMPEPKPSMSDEAVDVWNYVLRELGYMRIASPSDRDALAVYCEAVARCDRITEKLKTEPDLVPGSAGNMVRNPLYQIQKDAEQTIKVFAQQFGLTPSSRSGIRMPEASDDDRERLLS